MKFNDKIAKAFTSLSPREQKLIGAFGGMLVIFIGLAFWYFVGQKLSTLADEVEHIQAVNERIESNHEEIAEKFSGSSAKENREPVPQLRTFLNNISERKDVPVQNYGGDKSVPTKDKRYIETQMEVILSRVSIQQIVDFLEEIENAKQAAYTKQLDISIPRKTERDSFSVNITVATYEDPNAEKKAPSISTPAPEIIKERPENSSVKKEPGARPVPSRVLTPTKDKAEIKKSVGRTTDPYRSGADTDRDDASTKKRSILNNRLGPGVRYGRGARDAIDKRNQAVKEEKE